MFNFNLSQAPAIYVWSLFVLKVFAASGKSFQLSGGTKSISDFEEEVYAVSKKNSCSHTSALFTFNTQQLGSLLAKSSVASIITGRKEKVVYKNAEYSASLNDSNLDGGKIEFTDQPDSLQAGKHQLSKKLTLLK